MVKLNCIILFVHDINRLQHFYTGNFNLGLVEEINQEWVLLEAGGCQLGLHKIGAEYVSSAEAVGTKHSNTKIVFELEDDIFSFHDKLKAKGVAVKEVKTWENYAYWVCDGEDPEGNVFQLKMKK